MKVTRKTTKTKRLAATTRTKIIKPLRALLLFAATLSTVAAVSHAQESPGNPAKHPNKKGADYAVIFGTVWYSENRALYGVHVELRRAGEKKVRWEAYSDHHGEFAFRVPPGKAQYELSADKNSLKALKIKGLENLKPVIVQVEYDERVDTGLHLTK